MRALVCLRCAAPLPGPDLGSRQLECAGCGQLYPVIAGTIPVLMPQPSMHLARLFLQHKRYLRRQGERVAALRTAAADSPERRTTLTALADAYQTNSALIASICAELDEHLSIDAIEEALHAPEFIGYSASLEYLERDWCGLDAGEAELASITAAIRAHLGPNEAGEPGGESGAESRAEPGTESVGRALVLGAGTGRIAWELWPAFEHVYAVDVSLPMAQQFQRVLAGPVHFYSVRTRSVMRQEDMVLARHTRPVAEQPRAAARDRLSYVVADAANLPVADGSMSAIVSAYFTDVLPLERYLDEVVRVLAPGGRFIHLGPLEYHFDDVSRHLSADQVAAAFVARGFDIVHQDGCRAEHLPRAGTMAIQSYDNWVFVAARPVRRSSTPGGATTLTGDTVLELTGDIGFHVAGVLNPDGERTISTRLQLPSQQQFTGATVVLEVLRAIDGRRTVDEALAVLTETFANVDERARSAMVAALGELLQRGALRVCSGVGRAQE